MKSLLLLAATALLTTSALISEPVQESPYVWQPGYVSGLAKKLKPARVIKYKETEQQTLNLYLFEPDSSLSSPRPCFLAIHGGGWSNGSPTMMYPFADWLAQKGVVGISLQYRRYNLKKGISVFECVKDARSAVRYLRAHAKELNIDPDRIIVCGMSAGAHLAAGTALFNSVNETGESLSVSSVPNALVLFSPVIDTSSEGFGMKKIGERWKELSPVDHVVPGLPPTIVFHGTADTITPYKGSQKFLGNMLKAGNDCTLITVEGAIHSYMFKNEALYQRTLKEMSAFLSKYGFIKE